MGLVALPLLPKTERMVRPEPDARSLGVKQQCGPASIPAWLSDAFTRTQQRAVRPDRAESASGRRAAPRRDAARAGGDPVQSHLRESERPPQSGSGPIRTSASSPLRSRGGAGPDDESDRPDLRGPKRAVGRQAASACPVMGAEQDSRDVRSSASSAAHGALLDHAYCSCATSLPHVAASASAVTSTAAAPAALFTRKGTAA